MSRGHRDPTANAAIGRVMKEQKHKRPARKIVAEFPDLFDGLTDQEARRITLCAWQLAGQNAYAVERHHLERAIEEHFGDGGGDAA